MYKHILVPTDGSEISSAALDQSLAFAKEIGAKVTVLTAVEPLQLLPAHAAHAGRLRSDYDAQVQEQTARLLGEAEVKAKALGVPVETVQATGVSPWHIIVDTAKEKGCDLIAMASHGRSGVAALIMGSVASKVLAHSTMPVLVYR